MDTTLNQLQNHKNQEYSSWVDRVSLERQSTKTLQEFIVDCVLNSKKLSQSDEKEVTKEMLAKLRKDKFYIAPRRDNIIKAESYRDLLCKPQ